MVQHLSDAEIERVVERSAAFRAARASLLTLDAAVAGSALVRAVPRRLPLASAGLLLVIASVTHAALVSVVPPSLAPIGRYLFAVAGLVAGASLLVVDRLRHDA